MAHGLNTGGLQAHSVGDDYPFMIIGVQQDAGSTQWRAVDTRSYWEGETRPTYANAQLDVTIRQHCHKVARLCTEQPAYRMGYIMYQAGSVRGNPYLVGSPEYGQYGSGIYDARKLQSLRECV